MVIGAQGQKLKPLYEAYDMERLFDNKVHLELWVKSEVRLGDERLKKFRLYG